MSNSEYTPPQVWQWAEKDDNQFASTNRPIAGATHKKELPKGEHPIQLYSLATPNGVKATLMLEELLTLGHKEAEYDAWLIDIGEGDQFGSGFVELNPNSKIPAMIDYSHSPAASVFESGAILVYLAEKFGELLPTSEPERSKCMSWLFWQIGAAPYLGGGFGHFYAYADEKQEYPINRFTMETKRQLDLLDKQLADNEYICGDQYTIADIAIAPWYGALVLGFLYDAAEFLDVNSYTNVQRWAKLVLNRPAAKRARLVNRTWGDESQRLPERHSASDIDAILNQPNRTKE